MQFYTDSHIKITILIENYVKLHDRNLSVYK